MTHTWFLADSHATEQAGRVLASVAQPHHLIFLEGTLGAGKTTLVRGFLHALGHQGAVKSPTYTLVEPYALPTARIQQVYHFDLYRLGDPEELEYLGFRDYLDSHAVCLVEWAEKGIGFLPAAHLCVHLEYANEGRKLHLQAPLHPSLLQTFEELFDKIAR